MSKRGILGQSVRETLAHTHPDSGCETLAVHALAVAQGAANFAAVFGYAGVARAIGLLHDAGKASSQFQAYIRGTAAKGGDHSTYGARLALQLYDEPGRILALCIAGHHAGLSDPYALDRRLDPAHEIPAAPDWGAHIIPPDRASLIPTRAIRTAGPNANPAFTRAFVIRMLFSCLVDADFLATESFMSGGTIARGVAVDPALLETRLATYLHEILKHARPTPLNRLRHDVLSHVTANAAKAPGLFTLTVPTGGGKTLASLSFALTHARTWKKRRVIYVVPFTAIIEQTADIFRDALGADIVLEHHSSFDWERSDTTGDGGDARDGKGVLRRAAENWDAPVIVTTAVQFFESLFANRTSRCRKLHNIVDSVIVLDEAQTLPVPLLLPCLQALDELARNYGASILLCTATQPALRRQDGALVDQAGNNLGLDISADRELAPDPARLHRELKRVRVEVLDGNTSDEEVAARFAEIPRMLCIVNSRAHARALFDRISGLQGAVHLTTLMCPAHRRDVLAGLRATLRDPTCADQPVRLVATSLIEAGVDISFPEVWRAAAGLDSIAQAAGRCNREGESLPALGRVVVFTPAEHQPPCTLRPFQQAAQTTLHDHPDALSPAALRAYFSQLYFQKGMAALDCATVGDHSGILATLNESARGFRFPFESIAQAFRLIDEVMRPVVVPWNDDAKVVLERVSVHPQRDDLRRLQQYTVGIPRQACADWLARRTIVPANRQLGDTLLQFVDTTHYCEKTGVKLIQPMYRAAESNIP